MYLVWGQVGFSLAWFGLVGRGQTGSSHIEQNGFGLEHLGPPFIHPIAVLMGTPERTSEILCKVGEIP